MVKVSIVGVVGSGKTVLLAALGDKYQLPDKDGMFFKACDAETFAFVKRQMDELRVGRWPNGTQSDRMQHVNWRLMRRREGAAPVPVGEVTMLDFAGEVYTSAFGGIEGAGQGNLSDEVEQLRNYVATSDRLVVLVNIADLCNSPDATDPKVLKTLWASMSILDFAVENGVKRVAIGLSQYERFRTLAEECGGPLETLRKYAPFIYSAYGHLPLFTLTAVDKTVPDAQGRIIPASDFSSQGLDVLVSWMLEDGDRKSPSFSEVTLSDGSLGGKSKGREKLSAIERVSQDRDGLVIEGNNMVAFVPEGLSAVPENEDDVYPPSPKLLSRENVSDAEESLNEDIPGMKKKHPGCCVALLFAAVAVGIVGISHICSDRANGEVMGVACFISCAFCLLMFVWCRKQ